MIASRPSYPAARSSAATVLRPRLVALEDERAARREHVARRRDERLGLPGVDDARRAAPTRAPRARARRARPRATYGGFETTRSNGPARPVEERRLDELDRERRAARRSRARARARPARRRSRSRARRAARPRARARSRRSRCRRRRRAARRRPSSSASARSTTISVSGRGTSARASVAERQPPEAPLAEDVRERLAPAAALERARAPAACSSSVERPVVLGVELEPREAERLAEQQLRVEPRRVDALALEELGPRSRAGSLGRASRRRFRARGGAPRRSAPR